MQTILSSEEKQALSRFFSDLGNLFDLELKQDPYPCCENDREDSIREALEKISSATLAERLAKIGDQYYEIKEWLR